MDPEETSRAVHPAARFVTTQWTRVLQARGESDQAKAALSDLCAAYYAPVLAFIERQAPDPNVAQDLTQEFFARLLARHGIGQVDSQKGRFRSFLLGAVKHFLSDSRDKDRRLKRGGGREAEPLDPNPDTVSGLQLVDVHAPAPDREFDRKWALTVLDRALVTLEREQTAAGKLAQFEMLKPWLTGQADDMSQAEAATRLQMNEGAVKVAIHRLRRRFRDLLKEEIEQTVNDPAQVDEELRYLAEALN